VRKGVASAAPFFVGIVFVRPIGPDFHLFHANREMNHTHTRGTARSLKGCAFIKTGGLNMSFGKGALLWLIGIPLPIILLLAFFWH
jgi:hypothetical protein